MALVSMKYLLDQAIENKNAIPAINVSNMETIMGLLEIAKRLQKPVILQVAPIQVKIQKITYRQIVEMVKLFLGSDLIDVAIHLDHAVEVDQCIEAIDAGFTSVMFDGSKVSYQENIDSTKRVIEYARPKGVTVEAELGKVGGSEGKNDQDDSHMTDTNQVKDFVNQTHADCLAVAIGNAHGEYKGQPNLDFNRLEEINSIAGIPLVLHGGTGISGIDIEKAIHRGIRKINVFTEIDRQFVKGFVEAYEKDSNVYMMAAAENARQCMMKEIEAKFKMCYLN